MLIQGSAQVSLADFSPESPSVKWYNILSYRFMQPSTSSSGDGSTSRSSQSLSASQQQLVPFTSNRHDKQESDVSVYRGVVVAHHGSSGAISITQTKEESSDESTIISSQTSTLTRNQGCDELQTAVSLRLEELANCLKSPEEVEEEHNDSDSNSADSEESDEEGILVEFMMEETVLEDVLEHEVSIASVVMMRYYARHTSETRIHDCR